MAAWKDIPLSAKLLTNVQESALSKGSAARENCFTTEVGSISAFPGMDTFATLNGNSPTYLHEWRGDLVAVSSGRVWLIGKDGASVDVTKVQVSGGNRVIFDRTENELLMAAGGQIIRLANAETDVLSEDAPLATHVGFIDGYVVANEKDSGRFQHCTAGDFRDWNPLDVFSAEGKPDDINAIIVTPFRELILTGIDSIEQFERLPNGTTPFFRRWAIGEGVLAPYTLVAVDSGTWAINKQQEFVRMSGQTSQSASDAVGRSLESISDWTDAWAAQMNIAGQKFIVLQMPKAENVYGTEGVTFLFDYRQGRWFSLFGWTEETGTPSRWPGWSYYPLWGRHFVGGNGCVHELKLDAFDNAGERRRVLGRTAHINWNTPARIDDVRVQVKRGVSGYDANPPKIRIRCLRDQTKWTRWIERDLGKSGDRAQEIRLGPMGDADTFQFEWEVTQASEVEVLGMQALVTALER